MQKQVDKSHYKFSDYMTKHRWISIWHQLDEVTRLQPDSVLEIGPGPGLFKASAIALGLNVKTLDIDPELGPDYVAPATAIPLANGSIDVTCAFQVLEHMPFETSMRALAELCRVARKAVAISLPDVETRWPSTVMIPRLGEVKFVIPRPFFSPREHVFDGEHYWEISKKGYSLEYIVSEISGVAATFDMRTYRVHENPYHRFFILNRHE
jgi:hypothetical protein